MGPPARRRRGRSRPAEIGGPGDGHHGRLLANRVTSPCQRRPPVVPGPDRCRRREEGPSCDRAGCRDGACGRAREGRPQRGGGAGAAMIPTRRATPGGSSAPAPPASGHRSPSAPGRAVGGVRHRGPGHERPAPRRRRCGFRAGSGGPSLLSGRVRPTRPGASALPAHPPGDHAHARCDPHCPRGCPRPFHRPARPGRPSRRARARHSRGVAGLPRRRPPRPRRDPRRAAGHGAPSAAASRPSGRPACAVRGRPSRTGAGRSPASPSGCATASAGRPSARSKPEAGRPTSTARPCASSTATGSGASCSWAATAGVSTAGTPAAGM